MIKDPNCKNKTYRDHDLEAIIFGEVRKLKTDKTYYKELKRSVDHGAKRSTLESRLKDIEKQIDRLMELYTIGTIDINVIKTKMNPLSAEKKSLEAELENMQEEVSEVTEEQVQDLVTLFDAALAEGDPYKVHDILAELIDHIEIDGEDIRIHWNF